MKLPAILSFTFTIMAPRSLGMATALCGLGLTAADAAIIIASGRNLSNPDYAPGAYYYSIDTDTGIATPISPLLPANGANGLSASGSQLVGFHNGAHGIGDPVTGSFTPIGTGNGLTLPGYEVLGGAGYGVPTSGDDRRLQRIDLTTSISTGLGIGNPIGAAMDVFYGDPEGTNNPNILALGSVGDTLYGMNTGTGKYNLVALDAATGGATIIGAANALATSGTPGARYDGFSSLTGVDEDGDGVYDTLYGNINFYDPDGLTGPLPQEQFGGIIRFDLNDGTWDLIGANPGVIFFGFGSTTIPEPGAAALAATLGFGSILRRRRQG